MPILEPLRPVELPEGNPRRQLLASAGINFHPDTIGEASTVVKPTIVLQ